MAHGYFKNFTLSDIFNNSRLAAMLPMVNYREIERDNGKLSRRTNMKTFQTLIFNAAKSSARPFYRPLVATRSGTVVEISGKCGENYDAAFNSVYNGIVAIVPMLKMTINDGAMIRSALKNGRKQALSGGKEPKLWLRVGSIKEIESMSKAKLRGFMDDVMKNLYFNNEFSYTQKQFKVQNNRADYAKDKEKWIRQVGAIEWRNSDE